MSTPNLFNMESKDPETLQMASKTTAENTIKSVPLNQSAIDEFYNQYNYILFPITNYFTDLAQRDDEVT